MTLRHVFLDQNHWIYLAKAYWGDAHKPRHKSVPAKLLDQIDRGDIRIPLNTLHAIELLRSEQPDRRRRLAMIFERFSRGWFVAPWTDVLPIEIHRAVIQTFDSSHTPPVPEIFGRGFLYGIPTKVRNNLIRESMVKNMDSLTRLAAQPTALFDMLTTQNEMLRARQKERILELNLRDAQSAEQLRAVRKPYAKDIHRRAQFAGYTYQFQDQIRLALGSIGRTLDDFRALGLEGLTRFWSQVPSLDVDCELTLYRDRQWSRKVQPNDFTDIGHLVLAVPYCDAVVVERFWARAIQETGLAEKYHIAVFSDL
ncbi:MAG TPA: hypothetical protein PKH89_09775, partial [Anaerolineae bacterium]|nr:hypothetical protein [Anaerolineae bacterium]